jgi:hypothetical protein
LFGKAGFDVIDEDRDLLAKVDVQTAVANISALLEAGHIGFSDVLEAEFFAEFGQGGFSAFKPDLSPGLSKVPFIHQEGLPQIECNGGDIRQSSRLSLSTRPRTSI